MAGYIDTNEVSALADELLTQLSVLVPRVRTKYTYYDDKQTVSDLGISLPQKFAYTRPGVGWAARAVNTLGDRLNFEGFAKDRLGVNELARESGAFEAFSKAKTDALIGGCSFIALADYDGEPKAIPFTAYEATGHIDYNTGRLRCGIAVTGWYGDGDIIPEPWKIIGLAPKDYILFTDEYTARFELGSLVRVDKNPIGRALIFPITYRQTANRPFGKSRINCTVRRIVDEVARLKVRYEIAAEFYSAPQRYINGLMAGAAVDKKLSSAMGKIWAIPKDEDGEKPEIGQLPQMSIDQFSGQKKDLARDFCAETALTLRNLGYETSNPTSAESLSAMSDDLLLVAQECQREMGEEFKRIAVAIKMLAKGISNEPAELAELQPSWCPIFQLDIGAAGDALYKLFEIMPELKGTTAAYRMLGLSVQDAEDLSRRSAELSKPALAGFMPTEEEQ